MTDCGRQNCTEKPVFSFKIELILANMITDDYLLLMAVADKRADNFTFSILKRSS